MMTFIEGIGDEVIYFVGVAIVIIILALAWNSTSVITVYDRQYRGSLSEHALFRTAFFLIERRRRSLNNNNTNASVGVINNNTEARNRPNNVTNLRSVEPTTATTPHENEVQNPDASVSLAAQSSVSTRPTTTESSSAATSFIGNDLLGSEGNAGIILPQPNGNDGFLQGHDTPEFGYGSTHPITETPSFLEKVTASPEVIPEPVEENPHSAETLADGHIRVRLKFLNDTQRLVEARLIDQLGQFKQRNFGEELGNNKIVRLIFNGQLLQRDQETLQFHGLFDNCVVHCHISTTASTPTAPAFSPQVELDLSRLMLPLFGLILGMIWCCRIQYRQYFNGTSTFALLCITGFFALSVVAMWLPARNRQMRG